MVSGPNTFACSLNLHLIEKDLEKVKKLFECVSLVVVDDEEIEARDVSVYTISILAAQNCVRRLLFLSVVRAQQLLGRVERRRRTFLPPTGSARALAVSRASPRLRQH